MTPRELIRAHLPHTVPTLLAERTVIVLTPITADALWAARAAWDFARAAARGGRRTALVDLSLEEPALQAGAAATTDEGIVDAFVFDASLTHVAREQDVPHLHYVGVGTLPSDPDAVWGSARWQRLARGFASEDALLLLYVPPAALPRLAIPGDALVILAAAGFDPAAGTFPGIAAALARGAPLLGVVTERGSVRQRAPAATAGARFSRPRSMTPVLAAGVVLATALAAGRFLLGRGDDPPATPRPTQAIAPRRAAPPPLRASSGGTPEARGDSLFYSVQVAAFSTLSQAMEAGAALERSGWTAVVTPVRLGAQSVWYRVLVGAVASPGAADSILRGLRAGGVVDPSQGAIQRTPTAYQLASHPSMAEAREALRELWALGVPAYVVAGTDGTVRVLVGAFAEPEQANAADSLLAAAGVTYHLVSRSGTIR